MVSIYSVCKLNLEGFLFAVLWSSLSNISIIWFVKSLVEFPWNFLVLVLILSGIHKTIFFLSSMVIVLFRLSVSAVVNFASTFSYKIIHFNLFPNLYTDLCKIRVTLKIIFQLRAGACENWMGCWDNRHKLAWIRWD